MDYREERLDQFGFESPFSPGEDEREDLNSHDRSSFAMDFGGNGEDYRQESLSWLDLEQAETDAAMFEDEDERPGSLKRPVVRPLLGGLLWSSVDKVSRARQAIFVSPAAIGQSRVEILFYVHGLLSPCGGRPKAGMAGFVSQPKFALGASVVESGRPIVLIVPLFQDGDDSSWSVKWLGGPAGLNAYVERRLAEIGQIVGSRLPVISDLIVAGHSKAYEILYRLARSHASPAMAQGPLSCLSGLWLLDASYGRFPHDAMTALLAAKPRLSIKQVYRAGSKTDKFVGKRSDGRLAFMPIPSRAVTHCGIPAYTLPKLLAGTPMASDEAGSWQDEAEMEGYANELDEEFYDEYELDEAEEFDEAELEGEAFGYFDTLDSEDENVIDEARLSPAERKAVEITSTFETGKRGGFFGLTGNSDGQGLSFGLVNWTIGTGSLQPLLRRFAQAHPMRWLAVFGAHAPSFRALIAEEGKAAERRQLDFAIAEMNERLFVEQKGKRVERWRICEPWVSYFRKLSEDQEFQRIQVLGVRDLLRKADEYCRKFGMRSERAFAFMFDAVSSHGKWWLVKKINGRPERQLRLDAALAALKSTRGAGGVSEADTLLAIADILGATSRARYADQVRARKRWFVTGIHPRAKELAGLAPSPDTPYRASQSREDEADEAENWFEAIEAEDEQWGIGLSEDFEDGEAFEFEEEEEAESHDENYELDEDAWQPSVPAPAPLPERAPVAFAPIPAKGSFWPIRTNVTNKRLISYRILGSKARFSGNSGRSFLAQRRTKRKGPFNRWHVGVDLFARRNDPVFACEAGTIVGFDTFYRARSNQMTYRLLVLHPASGIVANYGEVRGDSLKKLNLKIGSEVRAGQQIGAVSDTDMIHFETYRPATRMEENARTARWMNGEKAPERLLNPTIYLIFLSENGVEP